MEYNFVRLEEYQRTLDYLGFVERVEYSINQPSHMLESDKSIQAFLNSNLYFENVIYTSSNGSRILKRECNAFNDSVNFKDFKKLTYQELLASIKHICNEPDWGVDLPIFKTLFKETSDWILERGDHKNEFYFIYSGFLAKDKLIDYNTFHYFMSILFLTSKDTVVVINHGGD